ncbi:hypothetical protein NQZ68_009880 [Dissostichus eleginoides]|nr:hypothetical protein NQZ68_009880 [Dissostichus eleginoides]
MCCVKKTLEAQTDACEGLRVTTTAIDDRVSSIEKPRGPTSVDPGAGKDTNARRHQSTSQQQDNGECKRH